jgi:peptidoglycan-associated lipoprotein
MSRISTREEQAMIARYAAVAATLILLAGCSSSDETLTDSAGSAAGAAGAGIGAADTTGTGFGNGSELGAGALQGAGPGSQADLEVNVGDRVFFDLDSSTLNETARQTVERQAAWLQQFPAVTVTIEGHADQRGTTEYNLALGERRAAAVKDYLSSLGIDPARILIISYGKERLANPMDSEEAYAQNRRAVTVVNVTATN